MYLANLSDLHGAPVLICPLFNPTDKSAIKVSSVYPDLWETITPHPLAFDLSAASIDSVTEPIWFTFNNKALQLFLFWASWILLRFVTKRSSPTIWIFFPSPAVMAPHPSQSSWSKGSSIDTIGYLEAYDSKSLLS